MVREMFIKIAYKLMISFLIMFLLMIAAIILKEVLITDSTASNDRIVKILDEGHYEILYDTKTKVLYLQSTRGVGYQGYGGLTVMLDANGKPLLYTEGE